MTYVTPPQFSLMHLDHQFALSEQLQRALDSRVVIEQAKGITARGNRSRCLRMVAEAIVGVGLKV